MKFRVVMKEIEPPRSDNPFKPISIMGSLRRRVAEIEAESEDQVREFFADAVRNNMPSVRGFELVGVAKVSRRATGGIATIEAELTQPND